MRKANKEIDVTGTCCPIPLIRLRQAIDALQPGNLVQITGDDPIFEESVRDLCDESGYQIVDVTRAGRQATILIQM